MTIDRTKLAVWVLALAALGAGYLALHEEPAPRPEPAPIVVTIPEPPPVIAPVIAPAPGVVDPVKSPVKAVSPVKAKPAKPPEPKKVSVPVKPKFVAPRKKKRGPDCSIVPPEAYTHAEWIVIQTARSRGVPEDGIVKLRACLAAHAQH